MSNGIICDNCHAVLPFDGKNNESSTGEEAAWVTIKAANQSVDACSRACAVEMLGDDGPLRPVIDEWLEAITEIARAVYDSGEDDDDAED